MGRVVNVCISEKKGTQKHPIDEGEFIVEFGVKDDAHAGKWHRQVSLLSFEKVEEFNSRRICHENCEDASPGEIEKHINSIKDDKENMKIDTDEYKSVEYENYEDDIEE